MLPSDACRGSSGSEFFQAPWLVQQKIITSKQQKSFTIKDLSH